MAIYAKDMDPKEYKRNILELYEYATEDEIDAGLSWYQRANRFAAALATTYRVTLDTAAGVIAALSPGCSWEKNMIDATRLLENGDRATVSTYGKMKRKALRILYNGDKSSSDYLGDAKIQCFYQNIVAPDRPGRVTVDRHAVRAAVDYGMTYDEAIYYCNTPAKYDVIESAYKMAADELGILPQELQAIVWLVYRRLFVRNGQLELFQF